VVLGAVHRRVGVAQQRLDVAAVLRVEADAGAAGERQVVAVDVHRQADLVDDALHRAEDHFLAGVVVEDHHELVAAQARHRVALAQHRAQPLGHALQQLVAHAVAEAVVDELEVVQVDEHHRHGARRALREHRLAHPVVQQVAVGQAGERVVVRLVLELHLVALPLDGVLHRAQQQLALEPALHQVVLRAALHRRERDRLVVVAGQDDDRHARRVRVDPGEGLEAEAVREREVEQHERRRLLAEQLEAGRQALGAQQGERRARILREHLADEPRVPRVVLDEEDLLDEGLRFYFNGHSAG
jgi:hypothetical protein